MQSKARSADRITPIGCKRGVPKTSSGLALTAQDISEVPATDKAAICGRWIEAHMFYAGEWAFSWG